MRLIEYFPNNLHKSTNNKTLVLPKRDLELIFLAERTDRERERARVIINHSLKNNL